MLAVDRDRVAPGDVITFTIRVSSGLADPMRVDLPSLDGFEMESRASEAMSRPVPAGPGTWIELRLRAVTPGEWRLGPVNVRQGIASGHGDAVDVTMTGGAPPPVTARLSTPGSPGSSAGSAARCAGRRRNHGGAVGCAGGGRGAGGRGHDRLVRT